MSLPTAPSISTELVFSKLRVGPRSRPRALLTGTTAWRDLGLVAALMIAQQFWGHAAEAGASAAPCGPANAAAQGLACTWETVPTPTDYANIGAREGATAFPFNTPPQCCCRWVPGPSLPVPVGPVIIAAASGTGTGTGRVGDSTSESASSVSGPTGAAASATSNPGSGTTGSSGSLQQHTLAGTGSASGSRPGAIMPASVPESRWNGTRCLPHAIIVGAQKGGTTALFAHFLMRPDFEAPLAKEVSDLNLVLW